MSRVLTFSRFFPGYHPRAGQPTHFVEKIYNSIYAEQGDWSKAIDPDGKNTSYVVPLDHLIREQKHHTIRLGNHWKVGDKFSPRVWSGRPYASKQITIANDIEVKQTWRFHFNKRDFFIDNKVVDPKTLMMFEVSKNDGLNLRDLCDWMRTTDSRYYRKRMQIICWNDMIEYNT